MTSQQLFCIRVSILALALAAGARADIDQTVTLQSGNGLNLDTAKTGTSGVDILWDGSSLTPQGTATAHAFGKAININMAGGKSYFNLFKPGKAAPITAKDLAVNDTIAVFTNGGNTAAAQVTANTAGSITLHFITFGVTPAGPNVTAIQNNSSGIPAGFASSGIAPSSIFAIVGTNLSDPGDPVLQSSAAPGIPLELNGTSLTVTVNGTTTVHPALYYTSPTQLAAVLPANTPVGAATLTVTYRGATSLPATFQVVPSAPGINTYYTNSAVATDGTTGALITFANAATPGETIVLWTTGLGADHGDSDTIFSTSPHSVDVPVQVYIGAVTANVLYHGSAGYPGVNQINLTIPDSVSDGCWVSLAVVAGVRLSNVATLPISHAGGACLDPQSGLNGNQIAPSGGLTLRAGTVGVLQVDELKSDGSHSTSTVTDSAFEKYSGIYQSPFSLSPGGCLVKYPVTTGTIPQITGLDAGTISLTGPNGLSVTLAPQLVKGASYAALANGAIPQTGGTFTFKGTGGADVGSFTSTVTFSNPILTWTNQSAAASIDRSQAFKVTWTGGNAGSWVSISGASGRGNASVQFECLAFAEDREFTVPSYILSALPAGAGGLTIEDNIFTPLPASGLDAASAGGNVTFESSANYK